MNNGARAISWVATVLLAAAAGVLLVVLAAPRVSARSIMIAPDGSGEYPTIQAALVAAADGDSIILANGTYLGNGNRDIDFLGKAVTIASRSGTPQDCVIDCQGTSTDPHRAFWFHSGEDSTSTLLSLTICNGFALGTGGAILCDLVTSFSHEGPRLVNCALVHNKATVNGGAIGRSSSGFGYGLIIRDTIFQNNHADNYGGSISLARTDCPELHDCAFQDNTARSGGAVALGSDNYSPGPQFIRCTFSGNVATDCGGAVWGLIETSGYFSDCQFYGNTAGNMGGAAWISSDGKSGDTSTKKRSIERFYNCTFDSNSAVRGGAVYVYWNAWGIIDNCLFRKNRAAEGGAIYGNTYSISAISQSVFWYNEADRGGAMFLNGSNDLYYGGSIIGCTLANNRAHDGAGILYESALGELSIQRTIVAHNIDGCGLLCPYEAAPAMTSCDIFGNEGGDWVGAIADQYNLSGNISADPMFCDIEAANLALRSDSPCADDNNNGILIGALAVGCNVQAPWRVLVQDVPGDQGGVMLGKWGRHSNEIGGATPCVTYYELQRWEAGWASIAEVMAAEADTYIVTVDTPDVLTIGCPEPYSHYRVLARTVNLDVYFESLADSGYSVDNLPPFEPTIEVYDNETSRSLVWDNPAVSDFWQSCLYRGSEPGFESGEPLLCSATQYWYQEADLLRYWYRVRSSDVHGNVSEWSNEVVGRYPTAVPGPLPTLLRLYPNQPNPFNPVTTLRFDLPVGGRVHLEVYDIAARLIRTLLDVELPAGSHQAVWDGKDERGMGVASGSYFARLSAGGRVETVRMGLVR